jgi:hypothetical protein
MNDEIDDLYRPGSSICCGAALSKVTKTHTGIFYMQRKQGVCHTVVALPFTLRSILSRKKNYENSNFSQCKNRIFKVNK